ncbi:Enamine deaminase RidA, house cleaning of reactive enamine intermediates, YjgF/YER057c/UK114 family [Cyclobacterium lianum]|uniref:Enamine deaminase RidA, house cleaning of reactive enamine intermediates, YjgF/YER057c/UK114 family n=2 Tax=Cyclobacterium lianum TaxID=388280 RepID=A0A1M7Q1U9_9BACT|nr:Enamine deaminase RidA, house cleaning of reactive enamine intermediates, YjgF/YER057c/UK114 family [Cyclobacterium lianum]
MQGQPFPFGTMLIRRQYLEKKIYSHIFNGFNAYHNLIPIIMEKMKRRSTIKKLFASLAGIAGVGAVAKANTDSAPEKEAFNIQEEQDVPLFSGATKLGNTVYIAGKGAHFEGDIKAHTDHVLKELEKELVKAGSSMEKVLKVNVYLHDLNDYKGMNEVFRGRFGSKPPVRTTVATYGGVPGDSLVEMDCIAYI